jgi:hypothetical protein
MGRKSTFEEQQCGQDRRLPSKLIASTNEFFRGKLRKIVAERVGFEPTVLVKVHTLSKRAP